MMDYNIDYRERTDEQPSRMDIRKESMKNFKNSSKRSIQLKLFPSELKKFKRDYSDFEFSVLEEYPRKDALYLIKKVPKKEQ